MSYSLSVGFAYDMMSECYNGRKAERSGVPLINHIKEGLIILDELGVCDTVKCAFCLHPMFQSDKDLLENWRVVNLLNPEVVACVMEYRNTANAFLSDIVRKTRAVGWGGPEEENEYTFELIRPIKLSPIRGVNDMLIADKVQNRKDFELYHKGKHERSDELTYYFECWLEALGISEEKYQEYKKLLGA